MTSRCADELLGWAAKAARAEWGEMRAVAWAQAGGSSSHMGLARSSSGHISTSLLLIWTGMIWKRGCSSWEQAEDMRRQ